MRLLFHTFAYICTLFHHVVCHLHLHLHLYLVVQYHKLKLIPYTKNKGGPLNPPFSLNKKHWSLKQTERVSGKLWCHLICSYRVILLATKWFRSWIYYMRIPVRLSDNLIYCLPRGEFFNTGRTKNMDLTDKVEQTDFKELILFDGYI